MVKKWNFVIKIYTFRKKLVIFITDITELIRGELWLKSLWKKNYLKNRRYECTNKWKPKVRFLVYMEYYSKSLSFQLVKYCRPHSEGDFPFIGGRFWRGLLGVKKEDHSFEWSSYTPKRFWTAVAGMKIPSPRPLDDRGVLCEVKYRILFNIVKGGLWKFLDVEKNAVYLEL